MIPINQISSPRTTSPSRQVVEVPKLTNGAIVTLLFLATVGPHLITATKTLEACPPNEDTSQSSQETCDKLVEARSSLLEKVYRVRPESLESESTRAIFLNSQIYTTQMERGLSNYHCSENAASEPCPSFNRLLNEAKNNFLNQVPENDKQLGQLRRAVRQIDQRINNLHCSHEKRPKNLSHKAPSR